MELSYNEGDNVLTLLKSAMVDEFFTGDLGSIRTFTCSAHTSILDLFRQHSLAHLQSMGFDYDTSDSISVEGAVSYDMPGLGTLELIPNDTLGNTIYIEKLVTS